MASQDTSSKWRPRILGHNGVPGYEVIMADTGHNAVPGIRVHNGVRYVPGYDNGVPGYEGIIMASQDTSS